jgi:gamma-tubulin complex component 2
MKNVFFLKYGDVFSHFLDLTEPELSEPIDAISIDKLQSSLEHCFKVGTSVNDPYCFNGNLYRLGLSSSSLSDQLMKIANMTADDSSSSNATSSKDPASLTGNAVCLSRPFILVLIYIYNLGLIAMTIDCPTPFPLSIILSMKSLTKYQMVFRHLFQCQLILRQLSRLITPQTIDSLRLMETRLDIFRSSAGRLRGLKAKMFYAMNVLNNYMQMEVLEYHWTQFSIKLRNVRTRR